MRFAVCVATTVSTRGVTVLSARGGGVPSLSVGTVMSARGATVSVADETEAGIATDSAVKFSSMIVGFDLKAMNHHIPNIYTI